MTDTRFPSAGRLGHGYDRYATVSTVTAQPVDMLAKRLRVPMLSLVSPNPLQAINSNPLWEASAGAAPLPSLEVYLPVSMPSEVRVVSLMFRECFAGSDRVFSFFAIPKKIIRLVKVTKNSV
jgi:hypothetical protein